MSQHLQTIVAMVKKDVQGLLPLILLANVVFFIQPLIANLDVLAIAGDVEFWAVAQANFYWLGYGLGVLLMISVLQQDPADSLTHDWLTRPIARTDWLLAKLLFMLLTIALPVVLARFIINLSQDYSIVSSLSYALAINKLPAVLPVPLLIAAALLAPNLRKTIFLLVLVFLVFLLPAWSVTRPLLSMLGVELGAEFDGMMWLQALPMVLAGLSGTLCCYWLLYCRRKHKAAHRVFWASIVVVFFTVYPPSWLYNWDRAITIHQWLYNSDTDNKDLTDGVLLEPVQACYPAATVDRAFVSQQQDALLMQAAWPEQMLASAGSQAVTFATAIGVRNVPTEWVTPSTLMREIKVDWRIDRIRAQARLSADSLDSDIELSRSPTAVNRFAAIDSTDTDYWLIPGSAMDTLAGDASARLTLTYDLALLSPTTYELPSDGQRREFPELGSCKADLDNNNQVIDVECTKRGKRPALVSAELVGLTDSRVDSASKAGFIVRPIAALGLQHYELTLQTANLVDSSSILISAYQVKNIITKQLVSPGLFGDTTDICPLPGDEPMSVLAEASWRDDSPHQISSVAVERDVRVEVLDWRSGEHSDAPTLFLLPGLGATAHSYDDIARDLSQRYNVVGMTRRGTGDSSRPGRGYDIARLSQDVLQVMDTLELESVILVGHSIAGEELTYLGANHPGRFSGLIYLDAAYDRVTADATYDPKRFRALNSRLPAQPPVRPSESTSYQALQQYAQRTRGDSRMPPEGEILASYDLSTGTIKHDSLYLDAILMGLQAPDYQHINVPALAIYAVPGSPDALMEAWYDNNDPLIQQTVTELFHMEQQRKAAQMARFNREVPASEVLAIQNADHWIFVSHAQEVLAAIDGFIKTL